MRRVSLFCVLVLLLAQPTFAAQVRPPMDATRCPKGASTETSGVQHISLDSKTKADVAERFLNTSIYCPNACYDLRATLTLTYTGLDVDISSANLCKNKNLAPNDPAQTPKRGCAKGENTPRIAIETRDVYSNTYGFHVPNQTVDRTRCDSNAINSSVKQFFDGLQKVQKDPIGGQNQMLSALSNFGSETLPVSNAAISSGVSDVLRNALSQKDAIQVLTNAGMSSDEASQIVQKLGSSDPGEVRSAQQQLAARLNMDLNQIASIGQMNPPKPDDPPVDPAERPSPTTLGSGETQGGLQTQCGISGVGGNIIFAESRCGQKNYNELSSVQGPGHFLCETWNSYANSVGSGNLACTCAQGGGYAGACSAVNDMNAVANVLNQRYGLFQQQYGDQCTSAGLSWSSCTYAIHVFGEGGFRKLLDAYVQNPGASAATLQAVLGSAAFNNNASIFTNGGTVEGVFKELERRLGGTGAQIPFTQSPSSPFTGLFSSPSSGYYSMMPFSGSPFGNAMPFGQTSQSPSGSLTTTGSSVTSVSGTNPPAVPSVSVLVPKPTVSLIADPLSVQAGKLVAVAWSSVGMRSDIPCIIQLNGVTLSQSNAGTQRILATSTGTIALTAQCSGADGSQIARSVSVTVQ